MAKKVLITGVNGFLGSALWEHFKAKRSFYDVFGIDLRSIRSSRRFISCDLNNQKEVTETISRLRPDYIFHLAGGRISADKDLLRNNVLATESLLKSVTRVIKYRPRIIIPGSAAEYGETASTAALVRETASVRPMSFYGLAKNMQTNLGLMYARAGLNIVVARLFNVCGYGMPPALSLGRFSRQIALIEKNKQKPVIRTGYLGARRDFLDIEDVSSGFLAIAKKGKSGEIYNICSGNSYLMGDLLRNLIAYSRINNVVVKEDSKGPKGVDISVGSNAKVRKTTGWEPKVDINQSLRNVLSYYRKLAPQGRS